MTEKNTIQIKRSDEKDSIAIVFDSDSERAIQYETMTELDPDLQRISVFFTSSFNEARDLVKSKRAQLIVFPEKYDEFDFVYLQAEFRNAYTKVRMIPLVDNPTLDQYRESKKLGGVLDFYSPTTIQNYESIKSCIVYGIREITAGQLSFSDEYKEVQQILRVLQIGKTDSIEIKEVSSKVCGVLAGLYDFSSYEVSRIVLAECIYLPNLSIADYQNILEGREELNLVSFLSETGSHERTSERPKSAAGLAITAANYLATWFVQGESTSQIEARLKERPEYLKHASLRAIDSQVLTRIEILLSEELTERKFG